ncbi:hypothetical protein [Formosa sp. PL04]|uniref:hypothetical protein n=1 Tax=Formosa sp. PL04 TaxID=3081755 RepID=UPI0029826453|nr:hypothetical protein [Formosa sp. PL04]MDW5289158.1 hypothetical protein [Formosa sp. PL04]
MSCTAENPLAFFDWYLETEIYKDLKEFYTNISEEHYFNNIDKTDKVNRTIRVLNIYDLGEGDSEYITFSFEGSVKSILLEEVKRSEALVELGFQERFLMLKKLMRMLIF